MRIAWEREFRLAVVATVCCGAAACAVGRDDGPGEAIAVRLSPVRVDVEGANDGTSASSPSSPWTLFDRDTRAGWSPHASASEGPARVRVALATPTAITHLKVFGPSPYLLDVRTSSGAAIRGLEHVRLDQLATGWNTLRVADAPAAEELVFELASTDGEKVPAAGIGEIELWGLERPSRPLDARAIAALAASSRPAAPPGFDVVAATGKDAIDLGPKAESGAHACATIRFALARSPASYRRAWLAYAADGAFRSFVLTRSLNAA